MIHIRRDLFDSLAVGGPSAVVAGLENALRLEFSTIPIYLYALWSLDRAKNAAIAGIIRPIVIDEMLHMTLVCNILNALHQTPRIDDPDFAPTYPGPLPGGVESDLTVHLRPFSMEQLQLFLKIEQPETILNFPSHAALMAAAAPLTIGQFYMMLRQQIGFLKDSDFANAPRNQVDANTIDNAITVTNVKSAQAAIDLIVVQGEGTPNSPLEAPSLPAHFYRFNQIAKRAKLSPNPAAGPDTPPDQRFIYDGPPVELNSAGVFAAPTDPKAANFPANSAARAAIDHFNEDYRNLLKLLQSGFSGNADALSTAVDPTMRDLGVEGRKLMATAPANGGPLGPSFEYMHDP